MKYKICFSLFSVLLFTNLIILSSQNNAFKDGTFDWGEEKFFPGRADQKFCENLVRSMAKDDILYERDRSNDLEKRLLFSMPQLKEALKKKRASFSEIFLCSMKMSYLAEVARLNKQGLLPRDLFSNNEQSPMSLDEILAAIDIPNRTNSF